MASSESGAIDSQLKWHPEIDKVANFGNDHYFALVNNTPWSINISSGTAGRHINGLKFTSVVESGECYVHVCTKLGWNFSAGGTFSIKADPKDANDAQFIDFALSNPFITGRKIHAVPVDVNQYGKTAWKNLKETDTAKTFVYQNIPCVVKGEIQPGHNGCFVWKFCIQEIMQVKEQSQMWTADANNVKLTVKVTGLGTLSYQWMKDGEDITSVKYPNCTGTDTDTLTITPITPLYEGKYNCRISNQDGLSIESEATTVKMFRTLEQLTKSENPIGYAAQQLEKKAEEWEENTVVQAAKRMANLMRELDKYTKEEQFDKEELIDLLSKIIEISKEVVKVANRAAEACTSKLPKQDVLQQVDIIKDAVDFLEVLASVNAKRLKEGDQDAKEKLTRNATKLLDAVCDIIQAIDVATHTLSDETRRELDLPKWVKLAESK